jgi:hypothetical protein
LETGGYCLPPVLDNSASTPMAVLSYPVVLRYSASTPPAVLPPPVVLEAIAISPVAVLSAPVRTSVGRLNYRNCAVRRQDAPVAGIYNALTGVNNAVPVLTDSNGQLGTASSSRRYKEDIQDMGDTSGGLVRLRR